MKQLHLTLTKPAGYPRGFTYCILLMALLWAFAGQAQTVSTLAGDGLLGLRDGTGTLARFAGPSGVAVDASGNVYVADYYNHRIRKITSAGVVTTLAGSTQGNADGTGTAAKFYSPNGVAVDASGNVYVADYNNHRIRKITSGGVVTTLAGSTQGSDDGSAAKFSYPTGVAVDASGNNVYVADFGNHRIRRIAIPMGGSVSTLAGSTVGNVDGTGTAAKFNSPFGVAVDASGNVYVADAYNHRIRKITSGGEVTTLAGSTSGNVDATGTAAKFNSPSGVALDASGNVYVVDQGNNRIRKLTSGGEVTTLAGSTDGYADGTGTAAKFSSPFGVGVDASGNVYVGDYNNNRIRQITMSPSPVVLTCPTNATAAACQTQGAVNTAFTTWLATASASGGCNGVLTNNNTGAPLACGGSTTVTFTYTSDCATTSAITSATASALSGAPTGDVCQATFTVATPPTVVLTCPTNTTAAACQTQGAVNAAFATWLATASASGGCNGVLTNNNAGAPSACGGSTTVTFTYTSSCAPLTTTCQATFTVAAPLTVVLTCPTNTTAAACQTQATVNTAFATWLATASASGGCNGVLTNNNAGAPSATGGSTTVTFTYTSSCAPLTTTCQATFTVTASSIPTISCPANISVSSTMGLCGAVVNFTDPVGRVNCLNTPTMQTSGLPSGLTFPIGTTTVGYRVTAADYQTATCSFTVTVIDGNHPPTISCPANISVNSTAGLCGAVVNFPPPFPNCNGETILQTAGLPWGSTFPVGTTTNQFRVTAANSQTATCSFTVTVTDTEPPKINCPANISVNNTAGLCGAVVNFTTPVGTDNCSGATTLQTSGLPSGATFPIGTTTNTYLVTAANSQTATCSFTVTVTDNEPPGITCPANISVCQGTLITYTPPVGLDNCMGAVTTQISGLPSAMMYPVGITTNSFTVKANNNQTTTCSFTVTVQGKPTITLATQQVTLNEGNNQTLCDTDANPVNGLQFTVGTGCTVGNPVWRTQIGAGAWSTWSSTIPSSQPSDNQAYKYQAACNPDCPTTFTNPISVTINYRAATPQNVSLVADGSTVLAGEGRTICDQAGNAITFNATCGAGERLLYSTDGGAYVTAVPTQIVDGQYHNYRVRCQKSDGTPSCVETESAAMSLKITTIAAAPTASISPMNGCGTAVAFSGSATCSTLNTLWYNAATNQALPNLPTTTPNATTSYYARCQNEVGCLGAPSNTVTFTLTPVNEAPTVTTSADLVCTGTEVTVSTTCPAGATALWNTGVTANTFKVAFSNVTKATYSAKCVSANGCQSPVSAAKTVSWKAFELTFINVGQSKSATKSDSKAAWASQFITPDAGPSLDYSTEANPTIYFSENVNKTAPRFWTIQVETCALGTDGSLTFNMLGTPELGVIRSYNTHENNAPYFMYANRAGFTELYAQNHPAYGFFADNGSGGNVYDEGLPKGLYKLGVRYWNQKGQGSIYPSTRQPAGNILAYQEYWFRIQSKNGIGTGSARIALELDPSEMTKGSFAQVMPNPVTNTLHLKVSEAKEQKVYVSLVDASGRTLLQRAFVPETNRHQEEFEVSQLSNGMYFLKVNTADKQTTLKMVKVQ